MRYDRQRVITIFYHTYLPLNINSHRKSIFRYRIFEISYQIEKKIPVGI